MKHIVRFLRRLLRKSPPTPALSLETTTPLPNPPSEPKPSRKAIGAAVLNVLYPKFGGCPNSLTASWNDVSPETILHWREKIATVRAWASLLEDPIVRSEYANWLNYFERQIDDAETETVTHSKRREHEAWWKRVNRETQEAAALNIPRPPR